MLYSNKNLRVIINRRQEKLVTLRMQLLNEHPLIEETLERLIASVNLRVLVPGPEGNHNKN